MKHQSVLGRVSNVIHRLSAGWVALLGVAVFALFTVVILPSQAAASEAETGGGPSPDQSFFYTPSDLYAMAENYGAAGRSAYIRARFTFDIIWPLAYLLFLTTSISWLTRRAFPDPSIVQRVNLLPVAATLLDYLENIGASIVMARFPQTTAVVDLATPLFTMLKWASITAAFAMLIIAGIVALVRVVTVRRV
ncbi:MAG: hypothetical protein ACLFNT_09830 [Spirochaetales bacterium]